MHLLWPLTKESTVSPAKPIIMHIIIVGPPKCSKGLTSETRDTVIPKRAIHYSSYAPPLAEFLRQTIRQKQQEKN